MTDRPGSLRGAIADTLRDDIAGGRHAPGDRLPTEAEMARRFGVNRHTVREALKHLAEEGVVRARRGAGTFVAARPTDYPLGRRVRFGQNLLGAGRTPSREVLALGTWTAAVAEAEALGLAPGAAVHVYEGLSLADGEPIALFRSVFPADRFPDLVRDLRETGSVTAALGRAGVADYVRASTRLVAEVATATQAALLRLGPPAALIRATAVNVDAEGRPVERGVTFFAGERVTLTLGGEADGSP